MMLINETTEKFEVTEENKQRIDKVLHHMFPEFSRKYCQELIQEGLVFADDNLIKKSNQIVKRGDIITFTKLPEVSLDIVGVDLPLDIVYQDDDVIVINKAIGMVVHPAPGHYDDTLVNALMYHVKDLSTINGVIRPGIVHRIDKDTSGLLIVAKNNRAHVLLSEQLVDKTLSRNYIALVHGDVKETKFTIDVPIARAVHDRKKMAVTPEGKHAVTHVTVLQRFHKYTLISCQLETGRTHQIRVHMKYIGFPIVGDPLYTNKQNPFNLTGQFLHAAELQFDHPTTGKRQVVETKIPAKFQEIISILEQ
ncbi:MAG: RluA family pseudouridine synthase [Culicoidibacterales bacterium]